MTRLPYIASLGVLVASASIFALTEGLPKARIEPCSIFDEEPSPACEPILEKSLNPREAPLDLPYAGPQVLEDAFGALSVLQNVYYEPVKGRWSTTIDWTGAVVETVVAGMLTTLTKSLDATEKGCEWTEKENIISSIFAQVSHSFSGQHARAILHQAYDDILWVVLGWLEAARFVRLHADLHYPETERECSHVPSKLVHAISTSSWHGYNWFCAFADRARTFWNTATKGWDTRLCHGGMVWDRKLRPYKNTVTNQLWISASISMYQYFPGDKFDPKWVASRGLPTNDPVYLAAAIVGYKWLKDVNMTNSQGLYVDGYHVDKSKRENVECDLRDEMVYTYNQGIILTGQRGLFTVTGSPSYVEDGHILIQNVIQATGWNLYKNAPEDTIETTPEANFPPWRGIGRGGILEERCDAGGTCSQDGQTFKGIFFHHLTAFCAPLSPVDISNHGKINQQVFSKVQAAHDKTCRSYLGWVKHNMDAALATRDKTGHFGMWWGAGIFPHSDVCSQKRDIEESPANTTDYRNKGTPQDEIWGLNATWQPGNKSPVDPCEHLMPQPDPSLRYGGSPAIEVNLQTPLNRKDKPRDPNDRGRGRTVETQMGGLALIRAFWELSQR